MIWSLVILWSVLGGLWRRMLGGWTGLPRSICYAIMLPLVLPFALLVGFNTWWPYAIVSGLGMYLAVLWFFVSGLHLWDWLHDLIDEHWDVSWQDAHFIDGPQAVVEMASGATVFGLLGLCWLKVL